MISDLYPQLEFFFIFYTSPRLAFLDISLLQNILVRRDLNLSVRGLVCFGVWLVQSVTFVFTTSYPGDRHAREGHGDGSWDDLLCSLVCNLVTVDVF